MKAIAVPYCNNIGVNTNTAITLKAAVTAVILKYNTFRLNTSNKMVPYVQKNWMIGKTEKILRSGVIPDANETPAVNFAISAANK